MAKVSVGTVDRVLHNRGEVNEATRKKILKIVNDLGYTPNIIAKSLALKKVYKICALIPDSKKGNPYWQKPLNGIEQAREEIKHFTTNIAAYTYSIDSKSDFEKKFSKIMKSNPDGVIFTPHFIETSHKFISECKQRNIPVLFIDSNLESEDVLGYFGQDAASSGSLAASLLEYGLPENSTILILKLTKNKATSIHLTKREQGFLNRIKSISKSGFKTLSYEIDVSGEDEPEQSLIRIFREHPEINSIFVTNSRVHKAARVIKKLKKDHLLMVGYDLLDENISFLNDGTINFLICQKPEDQGYKSSMALFNYILSGREVQRVNYSPIDIITKENIAFYKKI